MTRFSAVAAALYFAALTSFSVLAQSGEDASENRCFPWQDFRDGRCVPKPTAPAPPMPSESRDCAGETRNLSGPCSCPPNTHRDAQSADCVADAAPATVKPADAVPPPAEAAAPPPPPAKSNASIRCDGGTLSDGQCACPAGFNLTASGGDRAGGICVKTGAENCQGGALTVAGTCLCTGQVVMSGDTYDLEFVRGKCIPKRCPVATTLREGKCIAASAATPVTEPAEKGKPSAPKEVSDEARPCGHGMIRTRSGCVHVRRKYPGTGPAGLGGLPGQYERMLPGAGALAPD